MTHKHPLTITVRPSTKVRRSRHCPVQGCSQQTMRFGRAIRTIPIFDGEEVQQIDLDALTFSATFSPQGLRRMSLPHEVVHKSRHDHDKVQSVLT